jgi:hypothetical protein
MSAFIYRRQKQRLERIREAGHRVLDKTMKQHGVDRAPITNTTEIPTPSL